MKERKAKQRLVLEGSEEDRQKVADEMLRHIEQKEEEELTSTEQVIEAKENFRWSLGLVDGKLVMTEQMKGYGRSMWSSWKCWKRLT